MSCGGFTIPGMPSCGCGGSGGSCSCGSKRQAPLNAPAVGAIPGYSPAGGGAQAYGGPAGGGSCACGSGGTQAGEHQSSGGASLSLNVPARIPGFPSWAVSSTRRCGGTCENSKGRSNGVQPTRASQAKNAATSREPTGEHSGSPERPLPSLRGVRGHSGRYEGASTRINDPPPAALPQETAWKPGPCHGDWIQIPGTNIWVCTGTQEWIDFDTGRRGYGVGSIDSGHSTSESPRQKNCTVQLWRHDLPVSVFCHLWVEVHHCDGTIDRWELHPKHNDPALGHIVRNRKGPGLAAEGTNPQMVAEVVLACTPADPYRCKCINRDLMLRYRYRNRYSFDGPNSNTFAAELLKKCDFAALAAKLPFCAFGTGYNTLWDPLPDMSGVLRGIWRIPGTHLTIPMNLVRYQ